MCIRIRKTYGCAFITLLLLSGALQAGVVQAPPGRVIISLGGNAISMKPMSDSAVHELSLNYPGFYVKISGEGYVNERRFTHVDLNMSFNNGKIEDGTMRESRLCLNYGVGWTYDVVKLSINPGLCYSSIGYQNNTLNKSVTETRFAPSLGLQIDMILLQKQHQYVALFVEGSAMLAKSSHAVHQIAFGINWQPGFRKDDRPIPQAY